MRVLVVLFLAITAVAAAPEYDSRIVDGSVTTIQSYPSIVALLYSAGTTGHTLACGGTILNNRSVLTAAHCTIGDPASSWRARVGSTYANSGGLVYATSLIINHPQYASDFTFDNDVSIVRIIGSFVYNNAIQPGIFPYTNYHVADNQAVWAAGWGSTGVQEDFSEELRHVQVWTVNQAICSESYAEWGFTVTDNMLCSGWLGVGGRGQCQGDAGGPIYHNGVVVGVSSWVAGCGSYPGINARVTQFMSWITSNA